MNDWTPAKVEERLLEAADVMKRLPPVRVPGYFSTWPKTLVQFSDLVRRTPGAPAPAAALGRGDQPDGGSTALAAVVGA